MFARSADDSGGADQYRCDSAETDPDVESPAEIALVAVVQAGR